MRFIIIVLLAIVASCKSGEGLDLSYAYPGAIQGQGGRHDKGDYVLYYGRFNTADTFERVVAHLKKKLPATVELISDEAGDPDTRIACWATASLRTESCFDEPAQGEVTDAGDFVQVEETPQATFIRFYQVRAKAN